MATLSSQLASRQLHFNFLAPSSIMTSEKDQTSNLTRSENLSRIEKFMRDQIGPKVMLRITDNKRTMLSYRHTNGVLYIRIHSIFEKASHEILKAIALFVMQKSNKVNDRIIDDFIAAQRPTSSDQELMPSVLVPKGEVHDLTQIYEDLNLKYFNQKIEAQITWSKSLRKLKRSTICLGSYSDDLKLIRMHPALDQSFVPEYFVAFVVYHEMLHQVHGRKTTSSGARHIVHSKAFCADERKFDRYEEGMRWQEKNLKRLLKY